MPGIIVEKIQQQQQKVHFTAHPLDQGKRQLVNTVCMDNSTGKRTQSKKEKRIQDPLGSHYISSPSLIGVFYGIRRRQQSISPGRQYGILISSYRVAFVTVDPIQRRLFVTYVLRTLMSGGCE